MSADDVCAICEFSAVRIGARRKRELGHEGERISRMAMRVARRVGAEACEANKVRERVALRDVTWSGSAQHDWLRNWQCGSAHRARASAVLTVPSLSDSPPFDSPIQPSLRETSVPVAFAVSQTLNCLCYSLLSLFFSSLLILLFPPSPPALSTPPFSSGQHPIICTLATRTITACSHGLR